MNTEIVKIDIKNIDMELINKAGELLKKGGLVAFPTETVYGIGANALNEKAIKNIYAAKGRPSDNPLIIHIGDRDVISLYAKEIPEQAIKLMDAFWPGPLTLIFKKTEAISRNITGGLDTVAIRFPSNPVAAAIIQSAGVPVAAPSANISGRPSPTRARHVIEDLSGRVDMIIDGGNAVIGLESTVVDVTGEIPLILRPGSVTRAMLERVVERVEIDKALLKENSKITPRSPGMKYRHYAPKGQITVVYGEDIKAIEWINNQVDELERKGNKPAIIATSEEKEKYKCNYVQEIGSINNQEEIAANLFKVLRKMDQEKVEFIFVRALKEEEIGIATMNRLLKAAGNRKIVL